MGELTLTFAPPANAVQNTDGAEPPLIIVISPVAVRRLLASVEPLLQVEPPLMARVAPQTVMCAQRVSAVVNMETAVLHLTIVLLPLVVKLLTELRAHKGNRVG